MNFGSITFDPNAWSSDSASITGFHVYQSPLVCNNKVECHNELVVKGNVTISGSLKAPGYPPAGTNPEELLLKDLEVTHLITCGGNVQWMVQWKLKCLERRII